MGDTQLELPLFPLNIVLFPKAIVPLRIFEERYKLMLSRILQKDRQFGAVLIKSGREVGGPAVPFNVGTTAKVSRIAPMGRGRLEVTSVGEQPFKIVKMVQEEPYLVAQVELLEYEARTDERVWDLIDQVKRLFRTHLRLISQLTNQPLPSMSLDLDAESLSYLVGYTVQADSVEKQGLLETPDVMGRLGKEVELLEKENSVFKQYLILLQSGQDAPPPDDKPYTTRFSKN